MALRGTSQGVKSGVEGHNSQGVKCGVGSQITGDEMWRTDLALNVDVTIVHVSGRRQTAHDRSVCNRPTINRGHPSQY